jgi:hypothetical protein
LPGNQELLQGAAVVLGDSRMTLKPLSSDVWQAIPPAICIDRHDASKNRTAGPGTDLRRGGRDRDAVWQEGRGCLQHTRSTPNLRRGRDLDLNVGRCVPRFAAYLVFNFDVPYLRGCVSGCWDTLPEFLARGESVSSPLTAPQSR